MFRLISLRLMESYFRHRWLYLIPILMMTILAAVSIFVAKPKYISRGVLFVQKQSLLAQLTSVTGSNISWQTAATVTSGELKELLQTEAFIRAVIQSTDLEPKMAGGQQAVTDTITEARDAVWVSVVGDNQILIGAVHSKPQVSLQLVNGVVQTYLQWKINGDRSESEAAHTFFTGLISSYKSDADQARQNLYNYLVAHPVPIKGERPAVELLEINRLQAELNSAQTRYTSAINKDENAQLAAAQAQENVLQSYVVIDSPRLPDKPEVSFKKLILQRALFVLVGMVISLLAVAGGAVLDRSFRFPIDVVHGINLPVLATVPSVLPVSGRRKLKRAKKAKEVQQDGDRAVEAPELVPVPSMELTAVVSSNQNKPKRRRKVKDFLGSGSSASGSNDQTSGAEASLATGGVNPDFDEPLEIKIDKSEDISLDINR